MLAAAVMWGSTGVAGEYLINTRGMDVAWITTYRTTVGGLVMLIILSLKLKRGIFKIWRDKRDALSIMLFGLIGVAACLYTYLLAVQYTNAPTATTLQYLAPTLILIYLSVKNRKFPGRIEVFGVICALAGVFIISTHGNIHTLSVSKLGLIICLLSAFALAFYSVYPKRLLEKYGSVYTYAWAQFIAGILMNIIRCPIWKFSYPAVGMIDMPLILVLLWQLIFGTMVSYTIYLVGVTLIGPSRASMLASVEPAATAILAAALLSTPLVLMDYLGIALITVCIIVLSLPTKQST